MVSNALQVCGNPECRAEYGAQCCDILLLPLLTHAQSIGDQHPTGKKGVELCYSLRGVFLNDITAFTERFNPGVFNPRATCGPPASFVLPGKGISQNKLRYEY